MFILRIFQIRFECVKPGLHYQRFCNQSRNFVKVNSLKDLQEIVDGTDTVFNTKFPQTFLTNPPKLRIHLRKMFSVITETLIG